ncbi:hypothetical protein J3A83DRAFT_4099337 [Scleroderma citrinum]
MSNFVIVELQNQYLQEWLPHQQRYLFILLDMEAPPAQRICMSCGGDGIYRCRECAHQPVFCTSCCQAEHKLRPFHRVQQWNGTFFEESSMRLASIVIHVGHAAEPYPTGGDFTQEVTIEDEDEWEDVEEDRGLTHLRSPKDRSCLVVVHTNGVHYCNVKDCTCPGAEDSHLQLTMAGLFPATTKQPRTAFTFQVLDDFIRDNVECGTLAMNYFQWFSTPCASEYIALGHISDRYQELLQGSRMWRLLKLLKWQGFHTSPKDAEPGELVLFCLACPQLGVNILKEDIDLLQCKFTRTLVMDGSFKAKHMQLKDPSNEVWLMNGKGFMEYLKGTMNVVEVSTQLDCSNHCAVNHANANRHQLVLTSIGCCSCARHGCFVPHAMVDFQKKEQQVNMDYALVHAVWHGLEPDQRVIHFYDINCQYSGSKTVCMFTCFT